MESLVNDDVSALNAHKYEMARDDVKQRMPKETAWVDFVIFIVQLYLNTQLVPSRLCLFLLSGARGVMGRRKASPPAPAARVTRRRLGTSQLKYSIASFDSRLPAGISRQDSRQAPVVQSCVTNPGLVRKLNSAILMLKKKSKFSLILFVYTLMIECSKDNGENFPRKCFCLTEKETCIKT